MRKARQNPEEAPKKKRIPPARTPEARESQMIALAESLAEEQLRNGTASSQIITHYLKLATVREQLEREDLREDIKLKKAKTESLESSKRIEDLYARAITQMRVYSGIEEPEEEPQDE